MRTALHNPSRPLPADSGPFMVADLARRWRTSEQHVIDLIDEGRLQAINIGGAHPAGRRFWRIPLESLRAFEANNSSLNPQPVKSPRTR